MATKSILKTVNIADKQSAKKFIDALENAQSKTSKEVVYSRTVSEAKGEEIRKIFDTKRKMITQTATDLIDKNLEAFQELAK